MRRVLCSLAAVAIAPACRREAPRTTPEAALASLREAVAGGDARAVFEALDLDSRWSVMSIHRAEREMHRLAHAHFPAGPRAAYERRYAAAGAHAEARDFFDSLGLHAGLGRALDGADRARRERSAGGALAFVTPAGARLPFARGKDGKWGYAGFRAELDRRKEHAANALAIVQRSAEAYRAGRR